jgi:thiamine biosynthesis lipoprotein
MAIQPDFAFEALGTQWQFTLSQVVSPEQKKYLLSEIGAIISEFDATYSRFREDSQIAPLAHHAGSVELPEHVQPMFAVYKKLYELTDGLFTPCVGQTLHDLGYDGEYSFQQKKAAVAPPPRFEDVTLVGNTLTTTQPVWLDFGAAGKGYLVDLVAEYLRSQGIKQFTVDGSGDIAHWADGPLRVGLEHPTEVGTVIGVAEISNQSICASSGSRRKWAGYHHIINPQTLRSPTEILATWVIAPSTMVADALSTCLFLVEPERVCSEFPCEYLILYKDFSIKRSAAFPATMFYS